MSTPRVSIVVVNWNARATLVPLLESLPRLAYPDLEVVVVDNASTDGSREAIRRLEGITVVENDRNDGYARAANHGIRATSGDYVLLLNPDTAIRDRDVLGRAVAEMERDRGIAALGVRLVAPDGALQLSCAPFRTIGGLARRSAFARPFAGKRHFWHFEDGSPPRTMDVDWVSGAFLLLRRSALDRVGLFDEGTPMDGEDYDLCYRLARAGWRTRYLAETSVVHVGNVSGAQRWEEHDRQVLGAYCVDYFLRRHRGRAYALAYRLLAMADSAAKMLYARARGDREVARALAEQVRVSREALALARRPAAAR